MLSFSAFKPAIPTTHTQVFKEGFPLGYVKSKDDFIKVVASAAPSWPDLSSLGENMGTVALKGDAKVYIKRFNLAACPQPIQVCAPS